MLTKFLHRVSTDSQITQIQKNNPKKLYMLPRYHFKQTHSTHNRDADKVTYWEVMSFYHVVSIVIRSPCTINVLGTSNINSS
ncbi:hypothetical protein GDO78_006476 [Eleutherodactylus coqui]|uniref:Uncharacterized protein n=1 Tax=Eleutherodactylus coqui TaxID=57060 RepID=A0A8J6FQY4_ELECQ|nr:hypothetical protein GDO78_006476 [Eleutherodactylus coqui]